MNGPCCINGYRKPRWVLDKENDRMKQAVSRCACNEGLSATGRVFARIGIAVGDYAALKVACDERTTEVAAAEHAEDDEAIAAWAAHASAVEAAKSAERQAAYDKLWAPRRAKGLKECTRCGGSGFYHTYGKCFRCEGSGTDPRKKGGK